MPHKRVHINYEYFIAFLQLAMFSTDKPKWVLLPLFNAPLHTSPHSCSCPRPRPGFSLPCLAPSPSLYFMYSTVPPLYSGSPSTTSQPASQPPPSPPPQAQIYYFPPFFMPTVRLAPSSFLAMLALDFYCALASFWAGRPSRSLQYMLVLVPLLCWCV